MCLWFELRLYEGIMNLWHWHGSIWCYFSWRNLEFQQLWAGMQECQFFLNFWVTMRVWCSHTSDIFLKADSILVLCMTLNILAWVSDFSAELWTYNSVINRGVIIKICLVVQTVFHRSSALGPLVSPFSSSGNNQERQLGQPLNSNASNCMCGGPHLVPSSHHSVPSAQEQKSLGWGQRASTCHSNRKQTQWHNRQRQPRGEKPFVLSISTLFLLL